MENIIISDIRIQVLNANLVRIEKKYQGKFLDENTFLVPNRNKYQVIETKIYDINDSKVIKFNDYSLYIPLSGIAKDIRLEKNGEIIYKFKKISNSGELPLVHKTKDVFALNDAPHILIPKEGYSIESLKNNHKYEIQENDFDIYLFIVNKDYKLLRKMYVELTGRVDLVRFQTLGLWNSRYYKYHDYEVKSLIEDYEKYDIPLDNFVIDTDWRKANDIGIGYEIDTDLFPNMQYIFNYAHNKNISIMFNDHPEPYMRKYNVFDYEEVEFREKNLRKLLTLGLDTWWYDRNWTTKLISPTKRIEPETFGMYLFNDITKRHYLEKEGRYHTRADIMGNVNNISNGEYLKINDSASHRYSIQWTGDINCSLDSLTLEVNNLIRGSLNEITYINSDIGGHVGNPDNKTYLKWLQYGVFSPIIRPHCTNSVLRFREPWNYDLETLNIAREYLKMRYRLLGYLYSLAFKNYETGEPIFKSLNYEYNDKRLNNIYDTYLMGKNILVSPLGGKSSKVIETKYFISKVKARYYKDIEFKELAEETVYNNLDLVWKYVKPLKNVPMFNFSAIYETSLKFNKDVYLSVKSDDGARVYIDDKLVFDDWSLHGAVESRVAKLNKNQEYKVKVEYFQGGGEACIGLYYAEVKETRKVIKLPKHKWIDLFNGDIYLEKINYNHNSLKEMPLYIKEGSLIPLLFSKNNTSELKYDRLILDYYPSKEVSDEGFIYEDDKKTVAYQDGIYRKTHYQTYYENNAINIIIESSIGAYKDDINEREIILKYHLLNDLDKISKVMINNKENNYYINKRNIDDYPFSDKETSLDSDVLISKVKINIDERLEIKIILK